MASTAPRRARQRGREGRKFRHLRSLGKRPSGSSPLLSPVPSMQQRILWGSSRVCLSNQTNVQCRHEVLRTIFRRTLGSKSLGMNFISCIAVIYFLLSLKDPWISNCPVCSKVSVSILAAWPILFSTFFLFPSLRILHYPLQQASLTPLNLLVSSAGHLSTSSPYLQLRFDRFWGPPSNLLQ